MIRGSGRRFSCNVICTVINAGDLALMTFPGSFDTKVLLEFLPRLACASEAKVFLIWDDHPVHRAAAVQALAGREHQDQVEVFPPPSYAPKLNPTELLNQDVKPHVVQQPRAHHRAELIDQVRAIGKTPKIVLTSCDPTFKNPMSLTPLLDRTQFHVR